MARLIRPLRRTLLSPSPKTLIPQQNPISIHRDRIEVNLFRPSQTQTTITRNFISEMRRAAFQDNILRLLRNEIQYELDQYPPKQPVTKFDSFTIDDRPGEQWIRLKRKFAENEEIKVEATMFDGAMPIPKSGSGGTNEDVHLHITLVVTISKGGGEVLEVMCSAWPNSIEITKLFLRRSDKMPSKAYVGPDFKELDDELQDSLYEFLEARGIDDEMSVFLHEYVKNKDKTELIRWMDTVKSYIESK